MSLRRVGGLAAIAVGTLLWMSCGDVYRPVVIPINITPPNSSNFHAVFSVSTNVPYNPGTALQIDVSGDTAIGSANMGVNPTHAATLPNNSRVFVASAGSLFLGDSDVITAFTPAADSIVAGGLGTPITYTYPSVGNSQSATITNISEDASGVVTITLSSALSNAKVGAIISVSSVSIDGYNGNFPISSVNGTTVQYVNPTLGLASTTGGTATVPVFCPYLPDFVATTQTNAVYVANYGAENAPNCNLASTDSVSVLTPTTNTMTDIGYLPAGAHPVAMVETPNALNLYVLNQGNNTVTNLSPTDLTLQATISVGSQPIWAVARPDGQRLYVVTQGDGVLTTIRTDTNAVVSTQSLGAPGANFVAYDKSRNRLYATSPGAGAVYVFNATTDPPTPIGSATGAVSIPAPAPCAATAGLCNSVMPVSVAALPDGSRFYVASYATVANGAACPDPNVTATGCVIPQMTVFDAGTRAVKTTVFPLLPPVASPVQGVQPFALVPVPFCAPSGSYTPASARFRMSAVVSPDSTRAYASLCDGGSVAIIATTTSSIGSGTTNTPDALVTDLPSPFSAGAPQPNGEPLPQNPVFLLNGQ